MTKMKMDIIEMEYSKVACLDEQKKVTTEKSRPSVPYHFFYPCDFLEEAVRALFKCFGLDNKSWKEDSSSPGEEKEPEKTTETNHQKSTPSTSEGLQVPDPSDPQEVDPPSSTTEVAASARVVRPPLSVGGGGQIN